MSQVEVTGPAWDLSEAYTGIDSTKFRTDMELAKAKIAQLQTHVANSETKEGTWVNWAEQAVSLQEDSSILLWNLNNYLHFELSVDVGAEKHRSLNSIVEQLLADLAQAFKPAELSILNSSDSDYRELLKNPLARSYQFSWDMKRRLRDTLLTEKEEVLLESLAPSGLSSWGNLYTELSGKTKCKVETEKGIQELGLAEASSHLYGSDAKLRKSAWQGIQAAWRNQQDTAASIVNSIAGWRLEVARKRSHSRNFNFLTDPLLQNRIEEATLGAMIETCAKNLPETRKALQWMAGVQNQKQIHPWDIIASSPISGPQSQRPFSEAMKIIEKALGAVSPDMGNFVRLMNDKNWIEGRVLPTKSTGAYCSEFPILKQPRVFMSYNGSFSNVVTLAHEIGHAFHSWVIRDLPWAEQHYPSTLAETASIFAETILRDELFKSAQSREEKIEYAWSDLEAIAAFCINIPVRYEFEKSFYEARAERALNAGELSELMLKSWSKWYGNVMSEGDPLYWATKLHFSMAHASFYNFPYTFGYLFSLSIYARRKDLGSQFYPTYLNILRDTGRMTAEDLIMKHLGEDIRKPQFWQKAFDEVNKKIHVLTQIQ